MGVGSMLNIVAAPAARDMWWWLVVDVVDEVDLDMTK
jgi:hypothetical protein